MSFAIKYAPKIWSDIVITNESVRDKLNSYIYGDNQKPLLLYGQYGLGKTTIARLLPDAIEGKKAITTYLKAIEFATIKDVTNMFDAPLNHYTLFAENNKRRYFITNELNFTSKAAIAFRDVLDELQQHIQFIFTTNNLENIDIGLRDRFLCLQITPAAAKCWLPRIRFIIESEGIQIEDQLLLNFINAQLNVSQSNRQLLEKLEEWVWRFKQPMINTVSNDLPQASLSVQIEPNVLIEPTATLITKTNHACNPVASIYE